MAPALSATLREATTIGENPREREGLQRAGQTRGSDVAKPVFPRHGVDAHGRVVLRKNLRRTHLCACLAPLPRCPIGRAAGSGAHDWGRASRNLGSEGRLLSPHEGQPSRPGDKTPPHEAAAICEAGSRPPMRGVALKRVEPQDLQTLQRLRAPLGKDRPALVNQRRGVWAD
jgi:transposase